MDRESLLRYSRLIAVDGIGRRGVERLRRSRVLVAGCGALGSMAAMQLAGSGVGCLRIVDFDTVDISNLQRQFFYTTADAGRSKADALAERIRALNPEVEVEVYGTMVDRANAAAMAGGCDYVVEATDNPASMLTLDSVCAELAVPCVMAGISEFGGQVIACVPGGTRYADLFTADAADGGGVLPCSMAGVAGPAAALAASIESAEALRTLAGTPPEARMVVFDLRDMRFDVLRI